MPPAAWMVANQAACWVSLRIDFTPRFTHALVISFAKRPDVEAFGLPNHFATAAKRFAIQQCRIIENRLDSKFPNGQSGNRFTKGRKEQLDAHERLAKLFRVALIPEFQAADEAAANLLESLTAPALAVEIAQGLGGTSHPVIGIQRPSVALEDAPDPRPVAAIPFTIPRIEAGRVDPVNRIVARIAVNIYSTAEPNRVLVKEPGIRGIVVAMAQKRNAGGAVVIIAPLRAKALIGVAG